MFHVFHVYKFATSLCSTHAIMAEASCCMYRVLPCMNLLVSLMRVHTIQKPEGRYKQNLRLPSNLQTFKPSNLCHVMSLLKIEIGTIGSWKTFPLSPFPSSLFPLSLKPPRWHHFFQTTDNFPQCLQPKIFFIDRHS